MKEPWYRRYKEYKEQLFEKKSKYMDRCRQLELDPEELSDEMWKDLIARGVHESNWQEGIYLDEGKTREIVNASLANFRPVDAPHINLPQIIRTHRREIMKQKRNGASIEELATKNLTVAYEGLSLITHEIYHREQAYLLKALYQIREDLEITKGTVNEIHLQSNIQEISSSAMSLMAQLEKTRNTLNRTILSIEEETGNVSVPFSVPFHDIGKLTVELSKLDEKVLDVTLPIDYIHFLHHLTMMGIINPRNRGVFRTFMVHVGDPEVVFPPPSAIHSLMEEYCRSFRYAIYESKEDDLIMTAAKLSYDFVRIHPYADGNGRLSRLIMNLVLWNPFFPVYIKANSLGRKRYAQALKRANRGDLEPLAAIICIYLIEVYNLLLGRCAS